MSVIANGVKGMIKSIYCPNCRRFLGKIYDGGAVLKTELKCSECKEMVEINYCTASSFYTPPVSGLDKIRIKD